MMDGDRRRIFASVTRQDQVEGRPGYRQARQLFYWRRIVMLEIVLCLLLVTGCSSSPGSGDDYPRPGVPQLSAQARDGFVELSWSAPNDAQEYRIYWSTTTGEAKSAGNVVRQLLSQVHRSDRPPS